MEKSVDNVNKPLYISTAALTKGPSRVMKNKKGGAAVLRWVTTMGELSFLELMKVYAETNGKTAREEWPDLPEGFALEKAEREFYDYLRQVFFRTPGTAYALWEVNGNYVSALRLEPYRDGLLIEALETAPDQRRRGYARSLLQAVISAKADEKLYSHVENHNRASMALHLGCGFARVSDFAVYIDGSVNYRGCTLRFHRGEE